MVGILRVLVCVVACRLAVFFTSESIPMINPRNRSGGGNPEVPPVPVPERFFPEISTMNPGTFPGKPAAQHCQRCLELRLGVRGLVLVCGWKGAVCSPPCLAALLWLVCFVVVVMA